jgi:hypothetical protein
MLATSLVARTPPCIDIAGVAEAGLLKSDMTDAAADHKLPIEISDTFVADILKPYRPHARYLKSARIDHYLDKTTDTCAKGCGLMSGTGRFAIAQSCYIDDTGHFNAVEFNICYNQLAYVLFGKCVDAGILQKLRHEKVDVISFPDYKLHQLPSMLIVSIEGVRFFKQLKSSDFRAQLTLDRGAPVGGAWFFFTSITFSDAEGVKAKGSVVLAFSPNFTPVAH